MVYGSGNIIDCSDVGFGSISCAGDGNTIRTEDTKINLRYQKGGAKHQTTSISGDGNSIGWTVSAQGRFNEVQKLQINAYIGNEKTNTAVKMEVHEGSVSSLVSNRGMIAVYLNSLIDVDTQNRPFFINVEISSPLSGVWFKSNLGGITMNQDADNGWMYSFKRGDLIVGTLQVSQAAGDWFVEP